MGYDPEGGIQGSEGWHLYQRISSRNILLYQEATHGVVIVIVII